MMIKSINTHHEDLAYEPLFWGLNRDQQISIVESMRRLMSGGYVSMSPDLWAILSQEAFEENLHVIE